MSQKTYDRLFFNAIEVKEAEGAITVSPNFLCPKCGDQKRPETRPTAKLATSAQFSADRDVDVNRQVAFTMPCCGTKVSLYVAVHKPKDARSPQTCVSTEPIKADWWDTSKL
jgi:predicted RNA-binding Zn-ribbon protein involved in translation (DUF1610 family)